MAFKLLFLFGLSAAAYAARPAVPLHFEAGPNGTAIARTGTRLLRVASASAEVFLSGADERAELHLLGAGSQRKVELIEPLPARSHYLTGSDPTRWRTNVTRYAKAQVKNAWPGIDVVYYAHGGTIEFDFVVQPGADPRQIRLRWDGLDSLDPDSTGGLILRAGSASFVQRKPRVYQRQGGQSQTEVPARYRVRGATVEFALARYDRTRPLIIDPVVDFTAYLGGPGYETGIYAATDSAGNVFVTGAITSNTIQTRNVAQDLHGGANDAFVAKFTPSGDLVWFTYLGGAGHEVGNGIAVDSTGIYVSGETTSLNFPVRNAVQNTFAGGFDDVFVTKLSLSGDSITYSTYLGGSSDDFGISLAVDSLGAPHVTGWTRSTDFMAGRTLLRQGTGGAQDAFVVKLTPAGNSVAYVASVGGNSNDLGTGIALDAAGNAYVTGQTYSGNFPVTPGVLQSALSGLSDAFVFRLAPDGSSLGFATLLGGSDDELGNRIAVDAAGNSHITGYTKSSNFPVANASQSSLGGGADTFVAKLSPGGNSLVFSTYLGGSGDDFGFGSIALDAAGSIYVVGYTASPNFPNRSGVQAAYGGGRFDGFVTKFSSTGTIVYSSFYGGPEEDWAIGVALDRSANVYITGRSASSNLPRARNEFNPGTGVFDIFVARISGDTSVGPGTLAAASPAALTFTTRAGEPAPAAQTLTLSASGAPANFALAVSTAAGGSWLAATPASGVLGAGTAIAVSVNPSGLPAGIYRGTITVNAPAATNSPLTVPVTLNVSSAPAITSLSLSSIAAGSLETSVTLMGSGFEVTSLVVVNGATVPTTFINANTLQVLLSPAMLAQPGTLQFLVRNIGTTPAGVLSNVLTLPVTAAGPVLTPSGVVNGASFISGPVAPGEIITILGTGFGPASVVSATPDLSGNMPTTLAETRVLFDDLPAPILNTGPNQVSAVAPYAIAGRTSVNLRVEYRGVRSAAVGVQVASASPALFSLNSTGRGQAAALNQDGTVNSAQNPAERGSVVALFGTGEGQTLPAGLDGRILTPDNLPKPAQEVSVRINGVPAEVVYAGGAPGQVSGTLQVNVRIPETLPANAGSVPLVLTVGGINSPLGITIAVR